MQYDFRVLVRFAFIVALVSGAVPVFAQGQGTFILPVPAQQLVCDAMHQKIYATVGSKGTGAMVNSVTVIDPQTGIVGPSLFVGDSPGAMVVSAGSKYLYVSVNEGGNVRRVDLPGMTAGPLYAMPGKPVRALLIYPPDPEAFIALRSNSNRYDDALGVYKNGQLSGTEAGCAGSVMMGIAPSRLFTYQGQLSSWDFDGFDVTTEGVRRSAHSQSVMSGAGGFSGNLNGLLLSGQGVIDPETRQVIGKMNFNGKDGPILPDPGSGYVFLFCEGPNGQEMHSCEMQKYQYTGSLPLPTGVKAGVASPIRWGTDGFAYIAGDKVMIFRQKLTRVLPKVDLTVERSELPAVLTRDNQLSYQLIVTNKGAQPATAVLLTDAFPAEADALTMKASQGNVTAADKILRAELGTLAPGAQVTVDVTLQFKEIKEIGLTAVVRAFEPDPQPENNIARIAPKESLSPYPDLTGTWDVVKQSSIGAGVDLKSALLGQFTVVNKGKQASRPVKVRFYLSVEPRFEVSRSPLLQETEIPRLRAGQKFPVTLQAPIDDADATGFFVYAVIDADNTEQEGTRDNNVIGARIP
jgi:uncharacterized repeat protein (TIGR01451 family)